MSQPAPAGPFRGFPDACFDFYEGLQADNSKSYWTAHADTYTAAVRAPLQALLDALAPEFGTASVFRPYRDVRFAKDKAPYKLTAAAVVPAGAGALYLQLSADGVLCGGGLYRAASDQVARWRAAVDDGRTARGLLAAVAAATQAGAEVGGEVLTRVPRGFAVDHPRGDWLRRKSLTVTWSLPPTGVVLEPGLLDWVAERWRLVTPVNTWLTRHVRPPDPVPDGRR